MYRDRLLVADRIEEVEKLPLFIDTLCENAGIDATHAFNLNLALEEALVNVIQYAYPKDGLTHEITLDAECDESTLVFTLRDSGTPFDPTQMGDVDTTLSAQERQIGGSDGEKQNKYADPQGRVSGLGDGCRYSGE